MAIVKTLARQGNVTINPLTCEITYAGSRSFNEAMASGSAQKIWFQVPKPGGGDDCFASYDVEKNHFLPSEPVVKRHNLSNAVLQVAENYSKNVVRPLAELRHYIDSLPHG